MATPVHRPIVFLFDVDNTLLDNDRVVVDLRRHLDGEVGIGRAQRYWEIFEELRAELGVDYRLEWRGRMAGWESYVHHGDGLREVEDRNYRRLRTVLRHPLSNRAFRWLHPDLGSRLAMGSSGASREYRSHDEGAGLERVAFERLDADPRLELVVFGHSHVPALVRGPRDTVYANAGSWLDAPTYLHVTPERVELRRFDGSADGEGERLDVLDRRTEEALPEA